MENRTGRHLVFPIPISSVWYRCKGGDDGHKRGTKRFPIQEDDSKPCISLNRTRESTSVFWVWPTWACLGKVHCKHEPKSVSYASALYRTITDNNGPLTTDTGDEPGKTGSAAFPSRQDIQVQGEVNE